MLSSLQRASHSIRRMAPSTYPTTLRNRCSSTDSPLTSQTANQVFGTCGGAFGSNNCGSTTSDASLTEPTGLAVDAQGNLYVADGGGHTRGC